MNTNHITKASGEKEPFQKEKLMESMMRSGADTLTANKIIDSFTQEKIFGYDSDAIYKKTKAMLEQYNKKAALKYSIKRAIMELGPTGFPFEQYLSYLFDIEGYTTTTNVIGEGRCVKHEIDIVLDSNKEHIAVEVKFHNHSRFKVDLKTALYVKSRIDDLTKKIRLFQAPNFTDGMLVTNTRLTATAQQYANCAGLQVMSWNYPHGRALRDRIETYQLHPITSLHSISGKDIETLLSNDIVLCSDIVKKESILTQFIRNSDKKKVVEEARLLCE